MNNSVEIKKTVLGKFVFVSERWISNASFAIKKENVSNRDEFSDEKIFNLTGNYKGIDSDFDRADDEFSKWIECDFSKEYKKTNVCIREEKSFFTAFKCEQNDTFIYIDNLYVDTFNLEVLYGTDENDIVYVDQINEPNFFVADVDLKTDGKIIQKFAKIKSNGNSDSKMNKFFK
jgi:hypothetical protein